MVYKGRTTVIRTLQQAQLDQDEVEVEVLNGTAEKSGSRSHRRESVIFRVGEENPR